MKKIILWLIIGSALLLGADIVGSWKLQSTSSKLKSPVAKAFKRIEIYKNGKIKFTNLGSTAKWHHGKNGYYFVMMGDKVTINPIDDDHLSMGMGSDIRHYVRVGKAPAKVMKVKQSSVKFKLNSVYRAKIKGDYAFILLSKKHVLYFLQTDKKSKISVKEIKIGKLNNPRKSGYKYSEKDSYKLIDGNPYIMMEGKTVKVLSPEKLKYRDNVYRIQNSLTHF